MWDLNDSPDPMKDADSRSDNDEEEEENSSPENAATDNKGKEPESASTADNDDSGSSVLVAEASNEVDGDGCRRRRRSLLRAEGPLLRAHCQALFSTNPSLSVPEPKLRAHSLLRSSLSLSASLARSLSPLGI